MKTFIITIDLENDAFEGNEGAGVGFLLSALAKNITVAGFDLEGFTIPLMDVDGNAVGMAGTEDRE